jgi:hypothetical protein
MSALSDQSLGGGLGARWFPYFQRGCLRQLCRLAGFPYAKHKRAALAGLGAHPDLAFVRLHNLVNDGEA